MSHLRLVHDADRNNSIVPQRLAADTSYGFQAGDSNRVQKAAWLGEVTPQMEHYCDITGYVVPR